ncbi:hypothetical protein [uncultured Anaerococcus sp.]|uniref:hypothetical protein n=1 Tax=uncultured Anaerococcus sp. TaxID=293428 RepID=UPI00288999C9|nr:hypothetical protein [uncultured Anaerococcus sp.]
MDDKEREFLRSIEEIELKYLMKYYFFLKYAEDEMFLGFRTKEKIKDDWYGLYGEGISDFSVGAERIVYALINGKGIGDPNSCPVGSDMFFEVEDAFIHIDLKTVNMDNLGDFTSSIFVGENQNSYRGTIEKQGGAKEEYTPNLPTFYNEGKDNQKICLSYFITILYDKETLDINVISIDSMPNGKLFKHYGNRPLRAGKNPGKARFNINEVNKFELIPNSPSRIKVVYFNKNMDESLKSKLKLYEDSYDSIIY